MTSDMKLSASYSQFVAALGFHDTGFKIHNDDPEHRPKGTHACANLIKPIAELTDEEKHKGFNQVSIWRAPFFIIY